MSKSQISKKYSVFILISFLFFYAPSYSQETTLQDTAGQKQDTAKTEDQNLPVKCIEVIPMPSTPARLAVNSNGYIYVNVSWIHAIDVYSPSREKEYEIALQDALKPPPWDWDRSSITGIDIDLNDNIYLCNSAHLSVEKFSPTGEFLKKIVLPKSPKKEWHGIDDVVVDEDGTMYVPAHFKFVYIFDKEGNLLKKWTKSGNEKNQYAHIDGVAIDRHKNSKQKRIYLSDGYACRVYVFSKKDRRFLFSFGGRGSSPGEMLDIMGIDVDSEGYVYLLDRGLGYCSVFNTEGKFLFRFGHEEGGERFLHYPMSIFVDQKNKIYISNSQKRRILVYEWKQDRKKFK